MESKTIGSFIAALRKASGMTQKQLADKLCVSDKAVSRWERDECAPDLSLIPVIAEIFDVTCDELLRGQRFTREPTPSQTLSAEKQLANLLKSSLTRFRTSCILSAGIAAIGLLAGMVCNFAFLRGYLGFWIGCAFLLAGIVVFAIACVKTLSGFDSEDFSPAALSDTKLGVFDTGVATVSAMSVILAGLLPMLFSGDAYWGIAFGSWLLITLILIPVLLILIHFLSQALTKRFSEEGSFTQSSRRVAVTRLRSRCIALFAAVLLVLFLLHSLTQTFVPQLVYPGTVFDNWNDFKGFMETPVSESHYDGGDFIVNEGLSGNAPHYPTQTVTDSSGNVLCTYIDRNESVSSISFSFVTSEDGLPVTVRTFAESSRAHLFVTDVVDPIFYILYSLTPLFIFLLCRRKEKKLSA